MQQCGPESDVVAVCDLLPCEIQLTAVSVSVGHRVQHHLVTTGSDDALIHYTQHTNEYQLAGRVIINGECRW